MERLTLFRAVSHASLFPLQENEKAQATTAISGRRCVELYTRFNRAGSSLKTFADCFLCSREWFSSACALTWKMQGTRYNRLLFRLVPLAHRTGATEFGLSPVRLLGTPTATSAVRSEKYAKGRALTPAEIVKLLPTPQTRDYKGISIAESKRKRGIMTNFGTTLPDLMNRLLPTPRAIAQESYETRAKRKGHSAAMSYLESNIQFQIGTNSQLNPLFVAEMMGFPTNWLTLPFQNGATKV